MDYIQLGWLIVTAIFTGMEFVTAGFFIIFFAIGALCAFGVSFLTENIVVQIVIFIIVSTVLTLYIRPITKRFIVNDKIKTGVDALIDKEGIVVQKIDNINGTGQVKIKGVTWSAMTKSGKDIEEGERVIIKEVNGVRLIVEKI